MKLLLAFIITLITGSNTTAQNVGIGTSTPTQKLDVVGNLKVSGAIMPNGVAGTAGQVLKSNGTGSAPTWESSDLALPFFAIANSVNAGFALTQGGVGPAGSFAINNPNNGNVSLLVRTEGPNFAAQFSSTNVVPSALRTIGSIQFTGIGEGVGKTLTSDGNGNATWRGAVAFMAHTPGNANFTSGVSSTLIAGAEDFDEGSGYVNGIFTATQNGIYHFDVSIKWGTNSSTTNFVQATLQKCDNAGNNCVILASNKMNNQLSTQQTFGANVKLLQGEKVKVVLLQTNSDAAIRVLEGVDANDNISTFFSGHLVR